MKADKIYNEVLHLKPRIKSWIRPYHEDVDDVVQDIVVHLLDVSKGGPVSRRVIRMASFSCARKWVRDRRNRQRLEEEHATEISKNTTPTLSGGAPEPEAQAASDEVLQARWASLSPLLRKVARRTFFGYTEDPQRVARELGMTVAAVNMARSRIKKHMNGVLDGNEDAV